jgi:hypothetical protein
MNKPINSDASPLGVLREAIKAVPAVKYALGVAGVAAALALIMIFVKDLRVAGFGILAMFGLMFLLVIFAAFSKISAKDMRMFVLTVGWIFVTLTMSVSILLISSLFFGWPLPLKELIVSTAASPTPTPITQSSPTSSPSAQNVPATSTPTPTATTPPKPDSTPPERGQEGHMSGARRASAFVTRARSLYAQTRYQEAINECDKALRVDPGNRQAAALKGQITRTMQILNQ